ncbi:MAG: hypothetical protein O3C60_15330 [Planctomycetota bacterium]|nr:hypothetical protein [Planctomycetota bacterium]
MMNYQEKVLFVGLRSTPRWSTTLTAKRGSFAGSVFNRTNVAVDIVDICLKLWSP